MKKIKFKKVIALLLSMIICSSFCFAGNTASAVWYDFSGTYTSARFFPNSDDNHSEATLSITNWAEEEWDTDLAAHTIAYMDDYDERYTLEIVTYVQLGVTLSDYSVDNTSDTTNDEIDGVIDAFADGRECLNYSDHYSIIFFSSNHEVYRTYMYYELVGSYWVTVEDAQDGPTINIGFTQ